MATPSVYWILAIFIIHLLSHHQIKARLQALSPSFHTLMLQAKPKSQVTLCENQPWQSHVCQSQIIHDETPVLFKGLRMSTSYIVSQFSEDGKLIDSAQVTTKGFKVLATSCQKDETQVLVETGPFFGGYISLEPNGGTTEKEECKLRGDKSSRQTQYLFKILHEKCKGVRVPTNQTMQATLIVQEAWPILTASAKRFKLSCHFRASSFTVQAGLSMPSSSNKTSSRTPKSNESLTKRLKTSEKRLVKNNSGFQFPSKWKSENDVSSQHISRSEELPQENEWEIRASRLTTKDKPEAKNIFFLDGDETYPTSHIVLMVVLVISATVGSIATVIWIKKLIKERSQQMRVLWERKPEGADVDDLPNQESNEERDYENVSFSFSSTLRLPKCLNEQNSSFV